MVKPTMPFRCAGVLAMLALTGCYEYEQQPAPAQAPVAAPAPGQSTPATGQADAQPAYAGARQAAQNTVDGIAERQRELEKALEDDQ